MKFAKEIKKEVEKNKIVCRNKTQNEIKRKLVN